MAKAPLDAQGIPTEQKNPLRKLALTIALGLGFFILAETIARTFHVQAPIDTTNQSDLFPIDTKVGWRMPPNFSAHGFMWHGNWLELPLQTNNRGLLGNRNYPTPRQEREFRVLCLGDSTFNQVFFESIPEKLQRILDSALPDRQVWVQNAAQPGFSSQNIKNMAYVEIPLFQPDIVLILASSNDAQMTSGLQDPEKWPDGGIGRFGEAIADYGARSLLIRQARSLAMMGLVEDYSAGFDRQTGSTRHRVHPNDLQRNIEEMVEFSRAQGAYPMVCLYPWLFWDALENNMVIHSFIGFHLEAVMRAAQNTNAPLLDFIRVLERPDRAAFFMIQEESPDGKVSPWIDNIHLNQPGWELCAAVAADAILDWVEENHPDWEINRSAVSAIHERYRETPVADRLFRSGVPPREVWEALTEKMIESNQRHYRPWDPDFDLAEFERSQNEERSQNSAQP